MLDATIGSIHVLVKNKYRLKFQRSRRTLLATAMQGLEPKIVLENVNRIINSILIAVVIFALQTSYRKRNS